MKFSNTIKTVLKIYQKYAKFSNNNNNNNNNNIYRGSPTRQGGFQWGPHALI